MSSMTIHASTAVSLLTSRFSRRLFQPLMHGCTPIFMLHRLHNPDRHVNGHTIEFVKASLQALRNSGAKFVSLRTVVEAWEANMPVDPNWLAFTIDDGFADQADLVREAFVPMECPVTIFLITGFLDGELWPWDDQLKYTLLHASVRTSEVTVGSRKFTIDLGSEQKKLAAVSMLRDYCKTVDKIDPYATIRDMATAVGASLPTVPPPEFRPMTWDKARALEQLGVEFGPHSVTHRIFSTLPDQEARKEIEFSWSRLRKELHRPVPIFAWPTGRRQDFTPKSIAIARELGLQASVAADPGYARHDHKDPDSIYSIKRFAMPDNLTMVLRCSSWLERCRELLPI